jgi:hypothetical protein
MHSSLACAKIEELAIRRKRKKHTALHLIAELFLFYQTQNLIIIYLKEPIGYVIVD